LSEPVLKYFLDTQMRARCIHARPFHRQSALLTGNPVRLARPTFGAQVLSSRLQSATSHLFLTQSVEYGNSVYQYRIESGFMHSVNPRHRRLGRP
jgi:hypothetical protein